MQQAKQSSSAQIGYTVPFVLVHAGKYMTENKLKTDTLQKLNTTQKNKQRKIQQNKTSVPISLFRRYNGKT